jgi:FkbM family methyltransferase
MRLLLRPQCLVAALAVVAALKVLGSSADGAEVRKDILKTERALYSHRREELIIRDFFQDRRDGFFLDVGCSHPVTDNNTYYLEKHLGWTGIGVDGLPEFARKWRHLRPDSKFFNYLVTDHSDTVEAFYRVDGMSDISSVEKPVKGPGGKPVRAEKIEVPTITLTKLLERNGIAKIDFLSMDIEGYEPLALAGFEIERFRPQLACIEAKPVNREKLARYFARHHYQRLERYLAYDKVNYYYAPILSPR